MGAPLTQEEFDRRRVEGLPTVMWRFDDNHSPPVLVDLATMDVDHVIPEHLEQDPAKLAFVLAELGRLPDINVNSFVNWMPACKPCNIDKQGIVFDPSLLFQRGSSESR